MHTIDLVVMGLSSKEKKITDDKKGRFLPTMNKYRLGKISQIDAEEATVSPSFQTKEAGVEVCRR